MKLPAWTWGWLADLPTTNARIGMTLFIFLGTAVKYWITDKAPDTQWLIFIAAMAGVDALQYGAKRATFLPTPPQEGKDIEDTATKPPVKPEPVPAAMVDEKGEGVLPRGQVK